MSRVSRICYWNLRRNSIGDNRAIARNVIAAAESALGGSPERAFSKESVRVHNPCVGFEFEETTLNLNDTF